MKYTPKNKINKLAIIGREKSLIERHFNFIRCRIERGFLYCNGFYRPTEFSTKYEYRIKYDGISRPKVQVKKPIIEYNDDIHMFPKDNSLCLYHKSDLIWNSTYNIYNTIIPWTHEWFVFYELYKIHGKWLHPYVAHKGIKE